MQAWARALAAVSALLIGTDAAAMSQAATSQAQSVQPKDLSGVTITAEKPSEIVSPASQFVRAHLPETQSEQYPRFQDPICVKVQGLPDAFDTYIRNRIVSLAKEVGARTDGDSNCKPNINVIFVDRPQDLLTAVKARREWLLGFHFASQLKQITTFSRPVQAWYVTQIDDTYGKKSLEFVDPRPFDPQSGKLPAVQGRPGSKLGADLSAEVVEALIVGDARKVANMPVGLVADYVAVISLAKWQGLDRCERLPTVLNLFAENCDGEGSEGLTGADVGLLKGLYSSDPREAGPLQRSTIANSMEAGIKEADQRSSNR